MFLIENCDTLRAESVAFSVIACMNNDEIRCRNAVNCETSVDDKQAGKIRRNRKAKKCIYWSYWLIWCQRNEFDRFEIARRFKFNLRDNENDLHIVSSLTVFKN